MFSYVIFNISIATLTGTATTKRIYNLTAIRSSLLTITQANNTIFLVMLLTAIILFRQLQSLTLSFDLALIDRKLSKICCIKFKD